MVVVPAAEWWPPVDHPWSGAGAVAAGAMPHPASAVAKRVARISVSRVRESLWVMRATFLRARRPRVPWPAVRIQRPNSLGQRAWTRPPRHLAWDGPHPQHHYD